MNEFLPPLFPLGEVKIVEPAGALMARAGQDVEYFLEMHVRGMWCEELADRNKQALQNGSMILNCYRTFRGDAITVITSPDRRQTDIFGPWIEPGAPQHMGCTYDASTPSDYKLSGVDTSGDASADYVQNDYAPWHLGAESYSVSDPSDEQNPNLKFGDLDVQCSGLSQFKFLGFESLGYVPNMTYDCYKPTTDAPSTTTPSANDTPPDEEGKP